MAATAATIDHDRVRSGTERTLFLERDFIVTANSPYALLPAAGLLLCSHLASAVPKVVMDTQTQDFGRVRQGEVVSQTFRLHNGGDSVLRIEQARFSMPGMSIRAKQEIAPGASSDLIISWNTRGFTQQVKGQTLLTLNDPAQPQLILTSSGEVQAPLEVLPIPALYLSQYRGEAGGGSLEIRNHQSRPVQIKKLEPRGSHFSARLETLDAGKHYKLHVEVPADTPAGRYRESLLLHTDDPARPRLGIEVNVLVKNEVHVSPETVDFGRLSLSRLQQQPNILELIRQTLVVSNRDGAMQITSLKSDLQGLQLAQLPAAPSRAKAFRLDIGLDAGQLKPGALSGRIELDTDNPAMPHLSIPVSGTLVP